MPKHSKPTLVSASLFLALFSVAGVAYADYYAGLSAYERGEFETAYDEWLPLAKTGHPESQYRVARLFTNGYGVEQDDAQAIAWYLRAAKHDYARAQNNLGWAYENGRGVEQDFAEAMRWYRKAANQGRAVAQNNLGMMYDLGRGVPENPSEAAEWYRRAAQQGDARAQNNLGVLYDEGRGVTPNPSTAVKWYRRAAKQEHPSAQFNLGSLYENGRGVPANREKAIKWYGKAANQGLEDARARLDSLYAAEFVASDTTKQAAAPMRDDASVAKATTAPAVAEAAIDVTPVGEDLEAKSSYDVVEIPAELRELRNRADGGEADAQYRLGRLYGTGRGVPPDHLEAGKWYQRAAEQGHSMAGYRLAFLFLHGQGVSRDYVRAYAWFGVSAIRGVGDAAEWRDRSRKKMSSDEIDAAEALIETWTAGA